MIIVVDVFNWSRGFGPVMIVVNSMVGGLWSSDVGIVMVVAMIRKHQNVVIKVMLMTVVMMVLGAAALPFCF